MKKILFLSLLFLPFITFGQIPDPIPNTYINDLTGSLSKDDLYNLNVSILNLEKKSSVQVAVLIIPNLPPDIEIEDYAREVGKKWVVGNAKNGIVYVASLQEHKQRLEIAQNLEGDLPDVVCLHITDNLKPFLRNKDYAGAIGELISQIDKRVDPVAKEQLRLAEIEDQKRSDKERQDVFKTFGWIGGIGVFGWIIYYIFFLPGIRRRRKEEEDARLLQEKIEQEERNKRWEKERKERSAWLLTAAGIAWLAEEEKKKKQREEDRKNKKDDNNDDSGSSYKSSYRSSSDDDSGSRSSGSSFGNWGGGSSGGGSGFSGGGASNNW